MVGAYRRAASWILAESGRQRPTTRFSDAKAHLHENGPSPKKMVALKIIRHKKIEEKPVIRREGTSLHTSCRAGIRLSRSHVHPTKRRPVPTRRCCKIQPRPVCTTTHLRDLEVLLRQRLGRFHVLRRQLLAVPAPRCVELYQQGGVLKARINGVRGENIPDPRVRNARRGNELGVVGSLPSRVRVNLSHVGGVCGSLSKPPTHRVPHFTYWR